MSLRKISGASVKCKGKSKVSDASVKCKGKVQLTNESDICKSKVHMPVEMISTIQSIIQYHKA